MAAKVLLAVACALTVLSAGFVDADATLTWGETAKSGEPTTFTVVTALTAAANDRFEIHLPGFGGGYNAFGYTHTTTAITSTNYLPMANGISVVDNTGAVIETAKFSGAEWDPSREILKVTVVAGTGAVDTFKGVKIDSKFLKMAYSATGKASGLGPVPPIGGINSDWWKLAYVRQFKSGTLCTGSDITDVGLGKDTCKFDDFLVTPAPASYAEEAFTSTSATLASSSPRLPVNSGTPAAGAAVTPTFATLKAKGTTTGTGANNCITVTMVPNVNLVTTDVNSVTGITLHGLTGAATASTDALSLYLDGTCGTVPAAAAATGVRVAAATSADTSSAANILTSVDLLMSPASTKKTWQAAWNKEDGTLKFEVGQGRSISAGQMVVFSFQLVNGETVQESRAITASASGFMCKSNLCMPADDMAVEIPATAFHSSSKIIHVKPPTFETAKVSQSTTDPEQDATLTFELKPNKDLKTDASVLTITGLCGTLTNEDVTIAAVTGGGVTVGAADQLTTPGAWDANTKTLKITMGTAGFTAETTYKFSLDWKLLAVKNDACSIKVSATGTNTFAEAAMTNVDGKVGKVDEPMFKTLKIGQYTTRPDTDNYVCVTLKTNYEFNSDNTAEGANGKSTITLAGLLGSQKENEQNTELYPCPTAQDPTPTAYTAGTANTLVPFKPLTAGRSAATYDFIQDGGKAVFVMDTTGFARGTTYTFAMRIKNSKAANGCQTVTLTSSGDIAQTATLAPGVATDKAIVDGEMDGDVCPLKTYAPGFLVRKIAQDSKLATDTNTLTVTLRSNVDFRSTTAGLYSVITISGLTGTTTPDTTTMTALTSDNFIVADKFVPNFKSVDWKQGTGTLKLTLEQGACNAPTTLAVASTAASRSTCIKAGFTYVFSFSLKNGPSAQAAPPVAVKVLYGTDSEKNTDQQMMTGPADTALHALNILPETQILDTYKIGQLEAAQGGLNALCVTLTANKALKSETSSTGGNRFVAFTIRGLTGFATDSQTLSVFGTDGMNPIPANTGAQGFFCKDEACAAADADKLQYDSDKGEVTFFLQDAKTMAKGTDYSFCFQLTNPKMEMPCRDVTIAAKDKDMATSEAITFKMTQDSGMLANYAKGSKCAGYTAPRAFTTATLRLNSAVVGYEATAIVELVTNYKIDTQKVITISGLSGFKALSQGSGAETSDVDFVTFTENGMHAIDLGKKGTWDGVSTLTITTGTAADSDANNDGDVIDTAAPADVNGNLLRAWGALDSGSPLTDGAGTKTGAYMYELVFKMKNPASAQAAPAVSIAADDGFAAAAVDTGKAAAARRSGLALMSQRRAGSGAMTFTYKAVTALYGGESLVLDLPHYKGTDGAVFGVTSSPSDAFTTYENSNEWIANGVAEKKARAMFSQGFVATGSDHSATAGVNGILLLDSDDDGYNENKKNWFAEGSICDTKATQETTEGDATTAYTDIQNLYTLAGCSKAVAGYKADAFAGTVLTCNKGDYSMSRYVLSTKFNANVLQVVVDQDFPDATKDLEDDDNKKVWSACSLSYKSTVGKYTGHKVMMEDGEEYTIKQGAGPFYQVSDGSGTDVVSATLDGKKYTVYSQLVLTAKNGATIAEGEEVTITIPAGVLTAPADLSAPVNEEDDDKATIAEKTTIRHMLVAPMVRAPAIADAKSKFVLSKTWPYGTTSESESHLKGKMVELFGAASLLAVGTTGAALDDTKYKFEKVSSSVLSKKDDLSHTASAGAVALKGTGASALIAGVTSNVFWTAHADVEIDTTTGAITVDRATDITPITRTLTEPLNPPAFDASKAADDYLSSPAVLIDSIGQFLGNDPAVNGADTPANIVGLGTFVPQPISEFTAAVADTSLATLAVKDTNADTDRAKAFSSSIRAAITLVPEQMMAFAASGDCSAGPTEVRIAQGVKTCGSDLGAGSAGSLADRYPCGVKVVLEGAAADGPSLALPADMPAGACVSVKVLTAEDVEFPAEEAYNANAGVDALKKFKWGKKWMVVTQILGLDVTGLTSAVNVTSGAIVAMDGPPSRRRLLAACPEGYEYRMGAVGTTFADTCACPSACGEATASCAVTASGNWTAILVPASVCAETSADNTGAIVGGVVGGLLGLLLLAAIAYYCCRQQEQGPTGRAVAQEKPMVPVYLPQAYPVIPAEYAPAAAPMPVMPMEYVQQPMAVSVQPMMVEQQQQPVAYGM